MNPHKLQLAQRFSNPATPVHYAGRPSRQGPAYPGANQFGADVLSNAQKLWLHRRAMWFANLLSQPPANLSLFFADTQADARGLIASLTATALAGNDLDYITMGPTDGYSEAVWQAAHVYVYDNIVDWWMSTFPPVPGG